MPKKCIICEGPAEYVIKGTNDYYCPTHAEEYFGDISVLQTVEEQAKLLKEMIRERLDGVDEILGTVEITGQKKDED